MFSGFEQGNPRIAPALLRGRILLCPVQRAFRGTLPTSIEAVTLILAHLWLEGAIDSPMLCDFLRAAPETNGDTCEVCSAEGGGFGDQRTLNGHAEDVCL